MTPIQTSTPPNKTGLKYDAWLAKQQLCTAGEIKIWLERLVMQAVKKKGKRAA